MTDLATIGEARLRSPSPGRGGRFDDAGRRSPPPSSEKWLDSASNHRDRSAELAKKRRRDDSPPSRDRYIPNYEREPYRERDRRDPYPIPGHDRPAPPARYGPNPAIFGDPYRRGGSASRDDMFNYSPDRGGISNRGGHLNHSRSHLTPPSELPHLVTFRYFADYMRATSPHIADDKEKLAEQWKRYRQDHNKKQLVAFFEENKNKAWFREKYQPDPELDELRERLKKKGREGKVELFISRLEKGQLDIVNYDYMPASKKPPIIKLTADNPEERTPAPKPENNSSLPSTLHLLTTQEHETNRSVNDETKQPVNDGTKQPENDDPKQSVNDETKQSVHSFKSGCETATGSETEKLKPDFEVEPKNEGHSTTMDPEAEDYEEADDEFMAEALSGAHTGLTPSSALGNLIGENIRGKSGSDDIVILPPSPDQLFIKSISPDISRIELENHCKQVEGFDYLALSDPHTGKKLHRVGWVSFLPGTDMKAAENALGESKINNFTLHLMRCERPAFQKLRLCPGIMNTVDRIVKDLQQVRKMAIHFEDEHFGPDMCEDKRGSTAIEVKINQMKDEIFQTVESIKRSSQSDGGVTPTPQDHTESDRKTDLSQEKNQTLNKKALDFYIFYLRTVFHCCYYCVCVCDFPEELLRRCPKHVRKPASRPTEENSSTATPQSQRRNGNSPNHSHSKSNETSWARTLDERVTLILARSEVDPRDFGGERIDDEIHRLCQPQLTDEGAGKFRCKSCSKLFKAMNFIEKHIMTKHGEVINQDSIERIKYLNNYVLDPSHTTPQPPPLPDYGHSRSHNGISAGPSGTHVMMSSLGPLGHPQDFHNGAYPLMMNNSIPGPGGMMMGGPYPGYMAPMYPQYPNHPYPPMPGPSTMYPNGPMMGGAHDSGGGPSNTYGAPYYMGNIGPVGSGYPSSFPPPHHHQIYSGLPAIPPPPHGGRAPNGNSRRLGDRISRNFADDHHPSLLPISSNPQQNHKRSRRNGDDYRNHSFSTRALNGLSSGPNSSIDLPPILSDPRSKSVLAYNDLDTPAGDEVVLNY